jgi:hypothetical protein
MTSQRNIGAALPVVVAANWEHLVALNGARTTVNCSTER